jgi:hypothetical protein
MNEAVDGGEVTRMSEKLNTAANLDNSEIQ